MRIGVYLGDTNPEVGGGFTFQDEVLKALIRQAKSSEQHEFFVIGSSSALEAYMQKLQAPSNLIYLELKHSSHIAKLVDWLKKGFLPIARIVKWHGPLDRLVKHNNISLVWFVAGGCFELIDSPYIATVWDLQHRLQPWFPEVSTNGIWAGRELQYQHFLKRASYVIVGTDAGSNEVELFYQVPKFRIRKLPHPTPSFATFPVDTNEALITEKYGIEKNYIFYPAQFWPHKNHINLLQAIRLIRDIYRLELTLVLVGADKGNKTYVQKTANDLGISHHVHFLGFVPQTDLWSLYKNAALMSYVSLCGPENLPPLEAFAVGCPVLAADVSGSLEQFGNAVLYCDPKQPQDIAEKIMHLYANSQLKETLVEAGKKRAAQWSPDDFVKGIFNLVDDFSKIRVNWPS
jgi:glycosyltransferase involved in cell wall biosynthesis